MKPAKLLVVLLTVMCMVVVGGCSSKNISHRNQTGLKNSEKPAFNQDQVYVSANTTGVQLLKEICADSEDKNAIFSPLSLSTILAVFQNGAEGKTRQEINTLINPDQLPKWLCPAQGKRSCRILCKQTLHIYY